MPNPGSSDDPRHGSEVESPRLLYADPDHGCALFVPRPANPERSRAVAEHARRWWNGESEVTS